VRRRPPAKQRRRCNVDWLRLSVGTIPVAVMIMRAAVCAKVQHCPWCRQGAADWRRHRHRRAAVQRKRRAVLSRQGAVAVERWAHEGELEGGPQDIRALRHARDEGLDCGGCDACGGAEAFKDAAHANNVRDEQREGEEA
jgi:hypothetical protein